MRLFITGATGTIGRRLVLDRIERGESVVVLTRDAARASRLFAAEANSNIRIVEGDCTVPGPWQRAVDGVDAVIHLAGAGIDDHRWSASYKATLRRSRVDTTHNIVNAIEDARQRPTILISASGTGYYGDGGDLELDETAPVGEGFLARLCAEWEAQAMHADERGVRTIVLRIGVVLDPRGGALRSLLPHFRRFLGGPIGRGRQYVPWVHWRDVLNAISLALDEPTCRGPVNVVAPNPVTSREFAQALGDAIGRPSVIPMPWLLLRLIKGEFANVVVTSQRVVPARLLELGLRFSQPEVARAMRALLAPERIGNAAVAALEAGMVASAGLAGGLDDQRSPGTPIGGVRRRREVRPSPKLVRLLAIDVDGTLLQSDGRLTNRVAAAVRAAEANGCAVVLATARSPRLMRELTTTLGLQSPTINANGAVIWNPLDDRPQYHEAMSVELGWSIVTAARQADQGAVIELERLDRCHTDRVDPTLQAQVRRLVQPDSVGPLDAFLNEPLTRINVIATPERLARIAESLRKGFWRDRRVAIFQPHPSLLQVTHPLADKGIALQRIANRLRCARSQVMAIGDAINDLGMLEWSGFAVAMGNAQPAVRSLADIDAPSCDDHGVAWAIDRFVLRRGANGAPVRSPLGRPDASVTPVAPDAARNAPVRPHVDDTVTEM